MTITTKTRPQGRLWGKLKSKAKAMRQEPTLAEKKIWSLIRNRNLEGFKFRRQHAVGRFILDFYAPGASLAIEIDGPVHQSKTKEDTVRQAYLNDLGIRVIRFANEQVMQNTDSVIVEIRKELSLNTPKNSSPSPQRGEGVGG